MTDLHLSPSMARRRSAALAAFGLAALLSAAPAASARAVRAAGAIPAVGIG